MREDFLKPHPFCLLVLTIVRISLRVEIDSPIAHLNGETRLLRAIGEIGYQSDGESDQSLGWST
ncbi:MAG: hypothetical protein KUL87_09460 [Pseudomonas sp.]|nr:hypothetical protein [Pseudomonas sp.]